MAAYGTEEGLQAYAEAHGRDLPEGDLGAALMRAALYVDGTYSRRFLGRPTEGLDQEREWPRSGVPGIEAAQVPQRVVSAAYEAAILELETPGSLSVVAKASEQVSRLRAGPVELSFEGGGDVLEGATPVVSAIEGLLMPLLRKTSVPSAMVV